MSPERMPRMRSRDWSSWSRRASAKSDDRPLTVRAEPVEALPFSLQEQKQPFDKLRANGKWEAMPRQVTAFSNATVKRLRSLRDKKGRRAEGLFLAEGLRILTEARDSGRLP